MHTMIIFLCLTMTQSLTLQDAKLFCKREKKSKNMKERHRKALKRIFREMRLNLEKIKTSVTDVLQSYD